MSCPTFQSWRRPLRPIPDLRRCCQSGRLSVRWSRCSAAATSSSRSSLPASLRRFFVHHQCRASRLHGFTVTFIFTARRASNTSSRPQIAHYTLPCIVLSSSTVAGNFSAFRLVSLISVFRSVLACCKRNQRICTVFCLLTSFGFLVRLTGFSSPVVGLLQGWITEGLPAFIAALVNGQMAALLLINIFP